MNFVLQSTLYCDSLIISRREYMIANHIHDALGQVQQMRELVLARQRFKGYSGTARMVGGLVAIAAGYCMSRPAYPQTTSAHLIGWGTVLGVALLFNYGGLAIWFLRNPLLRHDWTQLKPAVDAIPALAIGAILSLALILHGQYALLFGSWMCLYGLAHVSYRQSLPPIHYAVGVFYMLAGTVCLLTPTSCFTHPWPMGIIFGLGELAGGFILYRNRMEEPQS
jgi:uncharacterized membrane protein HdeD (DUF308 family)